MYLVKKLMRTLVWVNILVTLANKSWPVFDGIAHEAAMNEIKILVVGPFCLHIINLEANIGWNPGRKLNLNR